MTIFIFHVHQFFLAPPKKWIKKNICWKRTQPQAIQDLDEFVSASDLEKCSIASFAQQWMLCSEWVPSEWESKQLIKHHNNPQVINILWNKKLHVCKKHFFLTITSPQYCFLQWKVIWSESGEKYAQIKHKPKVQNSSKQICGWILMWEYSRSILLWTRILAMV